MPSSKRPNSLRTPHRRLTRIASAAALLLVFQAALAQTAPAVIPAAVSFNVPAQPLDLALAQFARQAGLQLAASPDLIRGLQGRAVRGTLGVQAALDELLRGSGLNGRVAGGLLTIETASPRARVETTLPVVRVKADAMHETATGPVAGYVAKRSATATKTDTPLVETPQSVSVQGREELEDRGVTSLSGAARYVPGLQTEQYGGDPTGFTWFGLRGFADSYSFLYVDGLRAPGDAYAIRRFDLLGVERIEVLRGPASTLYGQGDAGGVVNIVSKRPQPDSPQSIEVRMGDRLRSLGADFSGGIDTANSINWRLVGSYTRAEDEDRYPDHERRPTRRLFLAPSLSWSLTPHTSLVLLGSLLDQKGPTNPFEYIGPDLKRTGVLAGSPSFNQHDQRQWELGYQFEHRLGTGWSVKQNMRTASTRVEMQALYGYNSDIDPVTGEIGQNAYAQQEKMRYSALDTQVTGSFDAAGIHHSVVAGIDILASRFAQVRYRDAGPALNIFLPPQGQYAAAVTPPTTLWNDYQTRQRQVGLYVQDQARFDRWLLTLGGRLDRATSDTTDHLEAARSTDKDRAFSGRLGVNYMLPNGFVPYASYAESFLPQSSRDANGNPFVPTRGKQYELGMKYQPTHSNLLLTAAIFDLRKTNVPTTDPDNPDYQRQTGEIRSRGLELEAKAEMTRQIKLTAQFTFTDVAVTRSNDGNVGKHPINVPKLMASAWLDYAFADAAPGLSAGLGIRHIGARYSDDLNSVTTPAYTLLDAAVRYDTGPWRLALNVANLLDKSYVATYAYGYYRGVPRTATASLKYRF